MIAASLLVLSNPNAVGQLPIMGWSGYIALMQDSGHCDKAGAAGYNETTFQQTAVVLESTGLRDLGYTYMNLDDCWIADNRSSTGELQADPTRFPHGMKWLADLAHQKKLKLGLYAAALINTGSVAIDLTLELRGVLCVACGDAAMVEDLWGTDPPVLATGAYTAKGVRPHETVLLRLSLVK